MTREPLIALIEDDEPFRIALADALGAFGFEVRSFDCAEAFMAAADAGAYDCVITDIQMPGMSGIELKRALTERRCAVPVIMITARAEPGLNDAALAAGAVCLLRKPFASDALIGCLDTILK